MENIAVEVKNLTFSYRDSDHSALSGVSFSLRQGRILLVIGESGCGKTTLLQHLKPAYVPEGNRSLSLSIRINGKHIDEMTEDEQAFVVGYVGQQVEAAQVTDKVWHELAFGLESLGKSQSYIRRRVSEVAAFFGLENVFHEKLSELSGGQKQMVNLAAVMVMEPQILLLDEPTSQLDPMSSEEFFEMVKKVNDELGTTIIMAEHRLENIYAYASDIMVLESGKILKMGTPYEVSAFLRESGKPIFRSLPVATRLFYDIKTGSQKISEDTGKISGNYIPLTVNEGRRFLKSYPDNIWENAIHPIRESEISKDPVLSADEIWFRYKKNGRNILKACSIDLPKGKITVLLGGNGAGKSTLLYVLSKQLKPYLGKVKKTEGKVGVLPQEPKAMFAKRTVAEELGIAYLKTASEEDETDNQIIDFFGLKDCLLRHPFDLSGGQQQKLALAKLVKEDYDIFLLDEPGKGMDYAFKEKLGIYLKELTAKGKTVLIVSHDVEFSASYADYCGLFFDGCVVALEEAGVFFSQNVFYTTAVRRMCSGIADAVVYEELMDYFDESAKYAKGDGNAFDNPESRKDGKDVRDVEDTADAKSTVDAEDTEDVKSTVDSEDIEGVKSTVDSEDIEGVKSTVDAEYIENAKSEENAEDIEDGKNVVGSEDSENVRGVDKKKLVAPALVFLLLMPLTIYLGHSVLHQRKYYFISLMLILEGIGAFLIGFDRGRPRLKEIMTIAVMSAITALSRAAFYMIPAVKPMAALTIISGIGLGGVEGFLVGALSMLVSDIFFSQGPWTPWQMFAMGLLGFLAGGIFGKKKEFDEGRKIRISVFGFLAVFIIYGGIMNPASVLMYQENVTWKMLLASYAPGIPIDIIHAVSTSVFLWLGAGTMLEKIERVRKK